MEKLAQLFQDVVQLWDKYHVMYLNGIKNTLILALVATVIGCLIGLVCGVLNTIPYTKNDPWPKRFLLKLLRVIIRIYVEVFRGTPMVLQAVFVYYGLPYFTDNAVKFTSMWTAAILIVSINTGAYMAESVRGGIISIDPGQTEGAKAIGMTHVHERHHAAGSAQHHAADRQQLYYQRQRYVCHVHHQLHRVFCCAPLHRRREQHVFPVGGH